MTRSNRSRLGVEALETRDVPAIFLANGVLNVIGGDSNDTVTVKAQDGGNYGVMTELVATRTETLSTPLGTLFFQESKTFALGDVNAVWVELGNGSNRYTGDHYKTAHVIGGSGRDVLIGGPGTDYLYGYGGNDELRSGGGVNLLMGGDGADFMVGGDGPDSMSGDGGNDIIYGEGGNDMLYGREGNDVLRGGAGNDYIYGDGGHDSLFGDTGDDALYGGAGNDYMVGGYGVDLLDGGPGTDEKWQEFQPSP